MQVQAQQIKDKCKEVFAKAKTLYPHLNFDRVGIRFDLKGRAAGMACRRANSMYMRFNADMMTREAFDSLINGTVEHEIAHIVCFMDPRLGRNHDHGWARVCRNLGGDGSRLHNEVVVYGKGVTYEYTTDRGHKVRVSQQVHTRIQRGVTYTWKKGKGKVTQSCAHSIVGIQGRTLATPIVKSAPATVQNIQISAPEFPSINNVTLRTVVPTVVPGSVLQTVVTSQQLAGESKAATSRRIMLAGYQAGHSYEMIISSMMTACGYNRQLARATFKANQGRVNIPINWGN